MLAGAGRGTPAFVPDAAGVGTTLYAAAYDEFDPRFGPGSRAAHLDAGARELADAAPSVCAATSTTSTTCGTRSSSAWARAPRPRVPTAT